MQEQDRAMLGKWLKTTGTKSWGFVKPQEGDNKVQPRPGAAVHSWDLQWALSVMLYNTCITCTTTIIMGCSSIMTPHARAAWSGIFSSWNHIVSHSIRNHGEIYRWFSKISKTQHPTWNSKVYQDWCNWIFKNSFLWERLGYSKQNQPFPFIAWLAPAD